MTHLSSHFDAEKVFSVIELCLVRQQFVNISLFKNRITTGSLFENY